MRVVRYFVFVAVALLGTALLYPTGVQALSGYGGGGSGGGGGSPAYSSITPSTSGPIVSGTATASGSSVTSLSYTYPAGTHAGDVMVLLQNGSALTPATSTAPSNQVDTQNANSVHDFLVTHIVQDEAGVGAGSMSLNGTGIFTGTAARLTNTPTGYIILDKEASNSTVSSATSTGPTVTTTVANDTCLCISEHAGSSGSITMTGPSGVTVVSNTSNSMSIYKFTQAAAGTTTACAMTDAGGAGTNGWANYVACFMPTGN